MIRFRPSLLLICLLSLLPATGKAADLPPAAIAERLQQTYQQTESLTADFRQVATTPLHQREKRGTGTLLIKKPGKMRWDYLEPERQVLIADQQTVSIYLAESEQMMISPAKEYLQSDVTYNFFTGKGEITRDFKTLPPDPGLASPDDQVVKLIPAEPHPQIDHLHLWVDKESFLIKRMQVVDHFGSLTDLTFSNIKTDVEIPADRFLFTPPAGTEIIRR